QTDSPSTTTTPLSNNTIPVTSFAAIDFSSTASATGTMSANILNNTVSAPLLAVSGGDDGIHIGALTGAGGTPTLCVDVFGNTANGSVGQNGVLMEQRSGSTLRLERLAANQGTGGA